jgi:hypothetical protein
MSQVDNQDCSRINNQLGSEDDEGGRMGQDEDDGSENWRAHASRLVAAEGREFQEEPIEDGVDGELLVPPFNYLINPILFQHRDIVVNSCQTHSQMTCRLQAILQIVILKRHERRSLPSENIGVVEGKMYLTRH